MRVMSMVMACAGLALAGARADEVSVPIDQLPKAVAEAVKNRFPKADAGRGGQGDRGR